MKYTIEVACSLEAYATIVVEAENKDELVAKLLIRAANDIGDLDYLPDWGTAGDYRVVRAVANGADILMDEERQEINE